MTNHRLKVIALCHDPLPSSSTYSQQLVWTMTELARLGHQVEVFGRNSGKTGRALREWISDYYGLKSLPESINFVSVGRVAKNSTVSFGLTDLRNVVRARREKGIIITRDVFALALALFAGMPCVFETYKLNINKDPRFAPWRAFCYSRKHLLGVVTHSELCRRSFIEAGLPGNRVQTIYNGFSPAHFAPELSRENARAQLNLNGAKHIVTYAGHVDLTKGVEVLLGMAVQLQEVKFLLLGANPGSVSEKRVLQRVQEMGAENVYLLPRVPQSQVPGYLFASDCLIIPPSAAPLRKHHNTVLPMKTFSYLAAGRPIIAPDLADLREMLRPNQNAVLVPPDDVDAAAAAVRQTLLNDAFVERLETAARRDASQYTWDKRAERLSAFLDNVARFAPR
jgi:glycosyltransferase involved in cell wall biosynthesis